MKKSTLTLKFGLILMLVAGLASSTVASGAEFQVNTYIDYDQHSASIAMDGAGNFVVVWNSYRQDGDSGGIFGQCFGADGGADGNEFQINSTTAGNQTEPSVAADQAGNFVVVWQGHEWNNEDIYGQRFDANRTALGGEFRVNDDANGRQLHPKVAMSKNSAFVVVWEDRRYWPMEYFEVMFKLYDANGTAVQTANANFLSDCRYPDVAMDADGDFTIVWMQHDIYPTSNIIVARRYDSGGWAAADPCQVSVSDFFSFAHPAVACDGTGHFVVAWDGNPGLASQDDIHARRYKFDGTALSDEFIVNTTTAGTQSSAKVSMNNQREFVIVWDSETDTTTNDREILGQRYDELFAAVGDEFRANTYTFEDQKYPAVAMREDGGFVTVWQSYGQDGSRYGIFGLARELRIEVPMKFTPQALNPGSKGKWVKAHFVLPEGFTVEDVDTNTPALIEPGGIESDYINVFINEDSLVELEIGFDRSAFCGAGIDYGPAEITVVGRLTSGQYFFGTDTVRIIANNLEYLDVFTSYWLEEDCGKPDWCGGVDLDQNAVVDFIDFALFDGCCIEVVRE